MNNETSQRLQGLALNAGGILLLIGAMIPLFLQDATAAPYVFTIGALLFGGVQLFQKNKAPGLVVRRLYRQQKLGAMALVAAGFMMFCSRYGVRPFDGSEWQLALAVGAILEIYTAFRIPAAILKEDRKAQRQGDKD